MDLASQLNPRQLEAVTHFGGPLLVLAGAGSGKTRVITYKTAHLVTNCGLQPWQILAVTFTNKAAAEMRARTEELLGPEAPKKSEYNLLVMLPKFAAKVDTVELGS